MYNSHPSLPPSLPSLPPFPLVTQQIHCPFQPKQSPSFTSNTTQYHFRFSSPISAHTVDIADGKVTNRDPVYSTESEIFRILHQLTMID